MGDESRFGDDHNRDWGDRYRRDDRSERFDRDERRYGAGDFEQSRYGRYDQSRFDQSRGGWPDYDPGHDSPAYRDRPPARGWERAEEMGYGPRGRAESRQEASRDFAGWDAPFGGRPVHDSDEREPESRRGEGRSFLDRTREEIARTRDELASLFGGGRRADDGRGEIYRGGVQDGDFRGRGPRGYRRSDERIREDVNDRLTEDSRLDASDIDVMVRDGEVTLDGRVRSRADKRRAEDIVERVSGVGHVQNNLRAADGRERDAVDPLPMV